MTDQQIDPKQLAHFQEWFADFRNNLTEDHRGESAQRHCTAYPLFIVQKRHLITGIDPQFTDQLCGVTEDGHVYTDPKVVFHLLTDVRSDEFFADHVESNGHFAELLKAMSDQGIKRFDEASTNQQWDLLQEHPTFALTVTGYHESWDFDSAHFTHASAQKKEERMAIRHGVDNVRIMTESGFDNYEFTQLVNALLGGYLAPVNE